MRNLIFPCLALALCACAAVPVLPPTPISTPTAIVPPPTPTLARPAARDVFETNRRLGRGMNIGNALEGPREGAWGVMIQDYYFPLIRKAGFDSVRLPIKWSAHAELNAPYTIDPEFMARIDAVVDQALKAGLAVVVNIHHFEEMDKAPLEHRARLVGLWRQIASHFKNRPEDVVFEILNEPNTAQTAALWNETLLLPLKEIRTGNPTRAVVVGGVNWNNVTTLATLDLPADDRYLIGTFHYYNPFHFTHQGAEWVEGASDWNDTAWEGTPADLAAVRADFDLAVAWGTQNKRPIFMGEFGAYNKAEMEARARWTAAVAREAEQRGFSWAYWEFASGFGAWSPGYGEWREPLLRALVPSAK
ncbi:MAG TPA: glycoside hydrolase family 5 protein [Thermoflexales bacterium]|nr:glycoside hydrolase family 5 protein [Anaerolineae bacterium]HQV27878.1 glycoside hydrolase family 5 protein [Thermoflexales bacterium]HQX09356.1 glycoside hydrolase family 5 protein [Thermoflexales bacterium]HRA52987.1 glycoside hydrolase family 5 protein [Thermoflexales bacterium]